MTYDGVTWTTKSKYTPLYQLDVKNSKKNDFHGYIGIEAEYSNDSSMLHQLKQKAMIKKSMVSFYANQDDSTIQFGGWDSRAVKGGRIHTFKADKYGAINSGKIKLASSGRTRLLAEVPKR